MSPSCADTCRETVPTTTTSPSGPPGRAVAVAPRSTRTPGSPHTAVGSAAATHAGAWASTVPPSGTADVVGGEPTGSEAVAGGP